MKSLKNMLRVAALGVAIIAAAAVPTKKAHAEGGAVVAGIAGGLILGSILGSAARAKSGFHDSGFVGHHNYSPPVALSFGFNSGHHFGHRRSFRGHHRGNLGFRGHGFKRHHGFKRGHGFRRHHGFKRGFRRGHFGH